MKKIRSTLMGVALVVATAAITTQVLSQDPKSKQQPPAGAVQMPPEVAEMWEKCTVAGTPGENHALLAKRVGKWDGVAKMWMMPDAPAEESTFTCEYASMFDGRYITESVEGKMGEETFSGRGLYGYDNVTKKFYALWIDSMSTSVMHSTGTLDSSGNTLSFKTEYSCPLAGKPVTGRTTERWIDDDHMVIEMYGPWYKTGKEYKSMELHLTRSK